MIKKKILFIQNKPTQFDHPLLNLLSSYFDLFVIYINNKEKNIDEEVGKNISWKNLNTTSYNTINTSSKIHIFKICRKFKPELVIISGWYPINIILITFLIKLFTKKLALRSDNIFLNINNFKKLFLRSYFYLFDIYMPVGKLSSIFFNHIDPNSNKKLLYFPYCVDLNWIENLKNNLNIKKNFSKTNSNEYIIVCAVKFNHREDPITMLKAFFNLKKIDNRYKLYLIGDGPLKNEIISIISSWPESYSKSVILPGYVSYSELIEYFSKSNLFVHPAMDEPFGVSLQEALACGLYSIVSNNVGSGYDFIISDNNGSFFNTGCVNDLVKKIENWRYKYDNNLLLSNEEIIETSKKYNYKKTLNSFLHSDLF